MEARHLPLEGWRRAMRVRVGIYFFLGLLALDGLVRWFSPLWDRYDPNDYLERLHRCQGKTWDLVVLGGSPVADGIDSALMHPLTWRGKLINTVYNLGLSGGTATDFWHALRHGVTSPPKLIVYGITASDLNDGRNEPNGAAQLMSLGDLAQSVVEIPETRVWVTRHYMRGCLERCWGLYQYRNGIRLWAADQVSRFDPSFFPEAIAEARLGLQNSANLRRGHGYAPNPHFQFMRYSQVRSEGGTATPFHFLDRYELGRHLQYVHRMRAWADSHGTDLVLVDMPVSSDLESRYATTFSQYREVLEELKYKHGFRVLHGERQAVGLDDSDFADLIHLNAWGVERFGKWLRETLGRPGATE
jgi:hypothetical protein